MPRFPKGSTPKLTLELIESIALPIRHGAYVETAVALAGVSRDTFYRWLKQGNGESGDKLTRLLSDTVKKAMAEAEVRDIAVIDRAAQEGEWTAAAWRLERKFPDRWGRQARVHLETQAQDTRYLNMTEAEKEERLRKIYSRVKRTVDQGLEEPDPRFADLMRRLAVATGDETP